MDKSAARLTAEEEKRAVNLMLGGLVHRCASAYCMDKQPDPDYPDIANALIPTAVSAELALLSIEQSLKLLLFLRYSDVQSGNTHDLHRLYKELKNKSGGREVIRQNIVKKMNTEGKTLDIEPVSEAELEDCLEKHKLLYNNIRYLGVAKLGSHQAINPFDISPREVQILQLFAFALIHLNTIEMNKRGIAPPTLTKITNK